MDIREKFINSVRKNIEKYNMISQGDTVCVGLSGGSDSVALLYSLCCLSKELGFTLVAAHVNHGIREEAIDDEEFCRAFCNKLGIEFHAKRVDIKALAKENKLGEEEMGRAVRYGFFREVANGGKIATAHNKNDNVETVFMRLIRGTGLNGLCGISFVKGDIIRPILNISKKEIEKFVEFCGLNHVVDKTNFQSIYTRNKIRLNVIPYIEENINRNVINTVGDNIQQYVEDADCLNQIAEKEFAEISHIKNNIIYIYIDKLLKNHVAIQKRIIMIAVSRIKASYCSGMSAKNIKDIIGILNNVGKTYSCGNIVCRVTSNYFMVYDKANIHGNSCDISIEQCFMAEEIVNNGYICYIPKAEFNKSFCVRKRQEGDIVRVCDGIHKKLSDFLSEKKIPREVRGNINVVVLNDEVIMIPEYFGTRYKNRTGDFVKIALK